MDEITQQVSSRTGLPEDQSRKAAQTVVDFLKQRLPKQASSAIDQVLANGQASGAMGQAADASRGTYNR